MGPFVLICKSGRGYLQKEEGALSLPLPLCLPAAKPCRSMDPSEALTRFEEGELGAETKTFQSWETLVL